MKFCIEYEKRGARHRTRFTSYSNTKKQLELYPQGRVLSKEDWERLYGPINNVSEKRVTSIWQGKIGRVWIFYPDAQYNNVNDALLT